MWVADHSDLAATGTLQVRVEDLAPHVRHRIRGGSVDNGDTEVGGTASADDDVGPSVGPRSVIV